MRRIAHACLWFALFATEIAVAQTAEDGEREALAQAVSEYFTNRWYTTELVVFARAPESLEQIIDANDTRLARNLNLLHPSGAHPFQLDLETAADLTWRPGTQANDFRDHDFRSQPKPRVRSRTPRKRGVPPPDIYPTLEPTPHIQFLAGVAELERQLERVHLTTLDAEQHRLRQIGGRLERRGMPVLMHKAWLQAVPARSEPQPILLQLDGAPPDANGAFQLEGTAAVTVGRYLHLALQLWLAADQQPPERFDVDSVLPETSPPTQFYHLGERRRARSGELHYFDHPAFGVIAVMHPVHVPDELIALYVARTEEESD